MIRTSGQSDRILVDGEHLDPLGKAPSLDAREPLVAAGGVEVVQGLADVRLHDLPGFLTYDSPSGRKSFESWRRKPILGIAMGGIRTLHPDRARLKSMQSAR